MMVLPRSVGRLAVGRCADCAPSHWTRSVWAWPNGADPERRRKAVDTRLRQQGKPRTEGTSDVVLSAPVAAPRGAAKAPGDRDGLRRSRADLGAVRRARRARSEE